MTKTGNETEYPACGECGSRRGKCAGAKGCEAFYRPGVKPSNPKDAAAEGKRLRWDVIPWRALVGAALAMSEGAHKYGRHNYRIAGVRASVYFSAALRHLFAWWEGEDIDPASGAHHVDKMIACLLVLRDAQIGNMCTDDRPPHAPSGWVEAAGAQYAEMVAVLRVSFGDPVPAVVHSDPRASIALEPVCDVCGHPGADDSGERPLCAEHTPAPPGVFRVCDRVRVIAGPFVGCDGHVAKVDVDDAALPYYVTNAAGAGMWCARSELQPYTPPASEGSDPSV